MSQPSDTAQSESFSELIGFVSHVAECYPDLTSTFPHDLARLITAHHTDLQHDLREKVVTSLVLLRNKDVIESAFLLQTLFPVLTRTTSKALRTQVYDAIVSDVRNANTKSKNQRLNKTLQAVLFNLVEGGKEDVSNTDGLWAVKLTREFWKRGIWDDARTVEIMKEASLSTNPKVIVGGVRFFLGIDKEMEEKDDSDDEDMDYRQTLGKLKHQALINKKSHKSKAQMEKAIDKLKKKERNKNKPNPLNFSALHLLRDPQSFAEMLFSRHLTSSKHVNKLNMDQKLLVLQLVSRLVGLHKLSVLQLYSYMLKYLTPRQRDVTRFLACAAMATHDLVPPDVLEPIVRKIADEFVSDGVASEVACAGLNSIREICARAPLAMDETLLQDLTEYKGSKDKGVMMAARSLIGLYREVAPEMLKRRDRGKEASMGMKDHDKIRFGEETAGTIEGLELLEKWKEQQEENGNEEDEEEAWNNWEVESDADSDDSGGWIAVSSDEEIEISDSEDEKVVKKTKSKTQSGDDAEEGDVEMKDGDEKSEALKAVENEEKKLNTLATTKILTPADFAKLAELKAQAGLDKILGKTTKYALHFHYFQPFYFIYLLNTIFMNTNIFSQKHRLTTANEEAVDENLISGPQTRGKSEKEARIVAMMEGREGREKYSSRRGKILGSKPHSTTNREKARKKNLIMTLGKAKRKQKRSLVEQGRVMRAHAKKRKQGKA